MTTPNFSSLDALYKAQEWGPGNQDGTAENAFAHSLGMEQRNRRATLSESGDKLLDTLRADSDVQANPYYDPDQTHLNIKVLPGETHADVQMMPKYYQHYDRYQENEGGYVRIQTVVDRYDDTRADFGATVENHIYYYSDCDMKNLINKLQSSDSPLDQKKAAELQDFYDFVSSNKEFTLNHGDDTLYALMAPEHAEVVYPTDIK